MARKKIRMNEVSLENDLNYSGPLSYRTLRIIGWIAMAFSAIAGVLGFLAANWNPATHNISAINVALVFFENLSGLAVPLFLVANFAIILQRKDSIIQLLLTHLFVAIILALGFLLLYYRYLTGIFHVLLGDEFQKALDSLFSAVLGRRLSFNVFVDLLIFSSLYFFWTFNPKKIFIGKKVTIFRSFAIFPIAWEIFSVVIKGLAGSYVIPALPIALMPFLASKPLFSFLAFFTITCYVVLQKHFYFKKGGTAQGYAVLKKSKYDAFQFSKFMAIVFVITAVLDLIAFYIVFGITYFRNPLGAESLEEFYYEVRNFSFAWGIGESTQLAIGAPVLLLFNYQKKHSEASKNIDILIPFIGVIICVLVVLEGVYTFIIYK